MCDATLKSVCMGQIDYYRVRLADVLDPIGADSLTAGGVSVLHVNAHVLPGHEEQARWCVGRILEIQCTLVEDGVMEVDDMLLY